MSELTTVADAVLERVLAMELLAVPDAAYASRRWVYFHQTVPFWVNRPGPVPSPSGSDKMPTYELSHVMRLVLGYHHEALRTDNEIDGNAQERAWTYQAAVMGYFERYSRLDPPGQAPVAHLGREPVTIECPIGLDLKVLPLSRSVYIAMDFELVVPVTVRLGKE
ncbi:MAG: hypothetical protein KO463_08130 [Candidatus Methanofastidiosa archaeon]|nr:hypothetical protein [Candidatus Methanofastidiosa archaeon]